MRGLHMVFAGIWVCIGIFTARTAAAYDPLVADSPEPAHVDLTVKDAGRSREIPIRVYLPRETVAAPVVLFSHGLGGSRQGYAYLGQHWAQRGYVGVSMQHIGSDDSVWRDKTQAEARAAMRKAVNVENFNLRVEDVSAVLDQLQAWNKLEGHALSGRMDLKHVGMAGHSFGAITTQAVSGEVFLGGMSLAEPRIMAAVAMSPSPPSVGDAKTAFGEVKIPWMLMTGTQDDSPLGRLVARDRLEVFDALPAGDKYELVLDRAEHSAFSDRALPGDVEPRNPNHHRAILALTTAFWDAYLRHDDAARQWLQNAQEPRAILQGKDQWRKK